jgi:pyridoxal phosphate enzyme (YggS family)
VDVAERVAAVRRAIAAAAARAGRDPAAVTLVAVSKGFGPEAVAAAAAAGVTDVGENRVQEALAKMAALGALGVRWHLIGRLQTNKVRLLGDRFHLIHAVDRPQLVEELARRLPGPQDVLMEVNVSGEASKAGVRPEGAADLARAIRASGRLRLRGLMTVAPAVADPEAARPCFVRLRQLRDRLQEVLGAPLPDLSMGMSGDFPVAVEEGATLVRVGRAIFGERPPGRT